MPLKFQNTAGEAAAGGSHFIRRQHYHTHIHTHTHTVKVSSTRADRISSCECVCVCARACWGSACFKNLK